MISMYKSLPFVVRLLAPLGLLLVSFPVFAHNATFGYLFMFLALICLFEGLELELFHKILIAIVFGVGIATAGVIAPELIIAIKPVGSKIFMNLLTMALVPLVFASILTGVTSLADIKKLQRIGVRTLVYYLTTTTIAITIGLALANIFQPGASLPTELRSKFESSFSGAAEGKVTTAQGNKQTTFETVQKIVPKNIMTVVSDSKPDMLALIFFAVLSGIALLKIPAKSAEPVIKFFEGITEMTVELVSFAMRIAPYGVFSIVAATIAQTESIDLLLELIPFSVIVLVGLFIHGFVVNAFSLKVLSGRSPIKTFRKMKDVLVTAFSTASSGGTMPLTLKTSRERLGVSPQVGGFVIPLGATINMDGTALFQGVSTLFLANIYGIELGISAQITVILMAVMASIGTAAVPGVGIVILTMMLVSVGIPPEGILFILPVNNLLDMVRTAVNVAGDMTCAIYIDSKELG